MRLELKNRFELKYLITIREKEELLNTFSHITKLDKHSHEHGYYVSSIYFDTHNFKCYREKIDGEEKRVKFRLRFYKKHEDDNFDQGLFLEAKAKENNTIIKDRVFLPREVCSGLISDNIDENILNAFLDHYAVRRFVYYHKRWHIKPIAAIQYKRFPLVLENYHNFRITFDHFIKCMSPSMLDLDFLHGEYCLSPNYVILEIKFNNRIPLWIMSYIKRHNLVQRRVSKYILAVNHLYGRRLEQRILV